MEGMGGATNPSRWRRRAAKQSWCRRSWGCFATLSAGCIDDFSRSCTVLSFYFFEHPSRHLKGTWRRSSPSCGIPTALASISQGSGVDQRAVRVFLGVISLMECFMALEIFSVLMQLGFMMLSHDAHAGNVTPGFKRRMQRFSRRWRIWSKNPSAPSSSMVRGPWSAFWQYTSCAT